MDIIQLKRKIADLWQREGSKNSFVEIEEEMFKSAFPQISNTSIIEYYLNCTPQYAYDASQLLMLPFQEIIREAENLPSIMLHSIPFGVGASGDIVCFNNQGVVKLVLHEESNEFRSEQDFLKRTRTLCSSIEVFISRIIENSMKEPWVAEVCPPDASLTERILIQKSRQIYPKATFVCEEIASTKRGILSKAWRDSHLTSIIRDDFEKQLAYTSMANQIEILPSESISKVENLFYHNSYEYIASQFKNLDIVSESGDERILRHPISGMKYICNVPQNQITRIERFNGNQLYSEINFEYPTALTEREVCKLFEVQFPHNVKYVDNR